MCICEVADDDAVNAGELHPQRWSTAQQARGEALILPVLHLGLDTSRVLYAYGRDPRQAADMTDAAGDLLPLCSMDGVDCRSMGSIVDYVRRFYCHLFSTKAGDCAT